MLPTLVPAAGLVWAAIAVLLIRVAPQAFYPWCTEDGPMEWAQALLFLFAGVALASAAVRGQRHRAVLLTLAALSLFVWLEEISWGQRIIGFRTPEAMEAFNRQNEFNLHNAEVFQRWRHALLVVFGAGGLALIGMRRLSGRWGLLARRLVPTGYAVNFLLVIGGVAALLGNWLHFDPRPLDLPNPSPGRMLTESLEFLIAFTWAGVAAWASRREDVEA